MREVTGFVIGGVPPVGHRVRIRTVLDPDLMKFDVIWAAAGTPRAVFQLTPQGRRHSDFDSNALTVTFNATFNKTFFVTLTTILALFSLAEIWLLRVPH